jgi:glycosyltransferase involved in cell wall biosynthesis
VSRPRVSIIIPCYNTSQYVGETLASVFAQTYTDYEVVLVNDGSPDTPALEAVLEPWRDRIVYVHIENRGLAGARNAGIEAAGGELIALLDSDDTWTTDYLEVQVRELDTHPDADIVYPNATIFGDGHGSGMLFMQLSPSSGEVTFNSLLRETCCPMVSVLARRSALEKAGLFDASLRSCEDFDMWLRAVKQGSRIIYHRKPVVFYRRRKGSLSSDPLWMYRHVVQVLRKMQTAVPLTKDEAALIKERIQEYERRRLLQESKNALANGDTQLATAKLRECLAGAPSRRLQLILTVLESAPRMVSMLYRVRQRH